MMYRCTRDLIDDLLREDRAIEITDPVDPHLELAEIHRRVYRNGGPALLFTNVNGCRFPIATNLFGTLERAKYIFRDSFEAVRLAVRIKTDPQAALGAAGQLWRMPGVAWRMRPKLVRRSRVGQQTCQLSELPQVTCWPDDGGAFITLPQVLSQSPGSSKLRGINLGMYRVQLSGGEYLQDRECGLHYQLHRGIGVHHSEALRLGAEFPVNITVGGTPAMTLAAVMPLPEGMSELMFAGALAGHRIPLSHQPGAAPTYADADFCVSGRVIPNQLKPEGPFGDHLGYYAKIHDFPVLQVDSVRHRAGAVWPMTVVGRPPQEDTVFGELIHELTGPVIPQVLPGVQEVHAVDAAGVHPLLLAVGSERYTPYSDEYRPQELLTQANAILGQGQLSLAKYLWIIDGGNEAAPSAHQIKEFFQFALRRIDWRRDLHFQTCTTMDTLDYSGSGLNRGSKVVIAAGGPVLRELPVALDSSFQLPDWLQHAHVVLPGILAVEPVDMGLSRELLHQRLDALAVEHPLCQFPLVVLVDDSQFADHSLNNFLWMTFTRSDPAPDIYGVGAQTYQKHFGCLGSLVIDARSKPHHAPGLVEDPDVTMKVDALAARGGVVAKYL